MVGPVVPDFVTGCVFALKNAAVSARDLKVPGLRLDARELAAAEVLKDGARDVVHWDGVVLRVDGQAYFLATTRW